jgi:DNA polymerase III delta prime subunit
MNWLDKYKPTCINDFKTNINEITKAKEWIENYKKNSTTSKKALLIIGDTGTGKTLLADVLLKEYNYQKIELNSTDVRSQKKLGEFLRKSLTYKNVVDMFFEEKLPVGILLDEIDTICNLTDKGGMSEFLDILKMNDKFEIYKKNLAEKKKMKKMKINPNEYIKLYNPIICTSNDINDKKINELKKYSEVIYLKKPEINELLQVINHIYNQNNQSIETNISIELIKYCCYDVRRLIILLEDLHYFSKGKHINSTIFDQFKKTYKEKEEDLQLLESTRKLFYNKMDITSTQICFSNDCLLTPLMIYHNSLDYIKNTDDNNSKKINIYRNVLESLCIHDTIQTNIYELQDWDELYDIASTYGATIPNYYFSQLKTKKNDPITIQFTSLLNKICQMYVNKKLLNNAKFNLGKLNVDIDEIIYATEIMSYYFEKYKNLEKDNDESTSEDITEEDDIPNLSKKPLLLNNSELISFMNKYHISIDGLENIMKIEKLNKINEKKTKKFTLKLKKDISNYLIANFN